jgi:hypothetical protein
MSKNSPPTRLFFAEHRAEVWIPIFRLPVILMISFSVVAWYKLGLRQSLDSLFRKQGNLFLDQGGLARCENIISRSYRCSCQPF